ncbi:protein pinocchio [Chironomus tepperi]|uniref:protein pinocchio n=1 Tax=Chironomus tepperi TaxID=113505 RepID=UPI00391EF31D
MKTDWNETFKFEEQEIDLEQLTTANSDINGSIESLSATGTSFNMSLVGVRSAPFLLSDYCSSIRSVSVSSSLSDMASSSYDLSSDTLNLEDLKAQLGQSCLSCGVCWTDDHFSFDCAECGGYAITKPCPKCDGSCGNVWTRDFSMTHTYRTAKWNGTCKYYGNPFETRPAESSITFINPSTTSCSMSHFYPNDLCRRLEKLHVQS